MEKKKAVSVIMSKRGKSPDIEVNSEVEAPNSELNPHLKSAAEDILRAIESKSPIDLATAIKYAFECLEKEPHEEGPHIGDDDAGESQV